MRNIPFIPKIQNDELLLSYLLRMYYANSVPPFSFNGFSEFINTFVVTKYDSVSRITTKYDIFSDLHLICENESSLDLFLNTTLICR